MTYGELIDWLTAAQKREELEEKQRQRDAWMHGLANLFAIGAALNENNHYPPLAEMFPAKAPEEDQDTDDPAYWAAQRADLLNTLNS